jgi:porin
MSDNGIEMQSILTFDTLSNVSGGVKRDEAYLGSYDLTVTVDSEKGGLWSGGTVFVYGLGTWGDTPSNIVGDIQWTDNIQAPETFRVCEAWINQASSDGKFQFLFGLHDFSSEFEILQYAGGLLNSSFGISIASTQVNPSIYPTTSLAARVRMTPVDNSYLQIAVYDGVPGDPNNQKGTQIKLSVDDGLFYGIEGGFLGGDGADYFKLALGGWYHTTDFESFSGSPVNNNSGMYLIGERRIYSEEDAEQGLGAFFQLSFADSENNQIDQYFGLGLSYKGLLPGRSGDTLSMGVAHARNGDEFRAVESSFERAETALELNYRIEVTPYFAITPDIQYVINPGTDPDLDNATVLGARFEMAM